jgi:hypothetical protein
MSNSGLSRTVKEQHRPAMKADYLDAKMQSHRGNLQRSARLLATQLTELERDYLHKRIEEGAEVARLELEQAAKAAQAKKPLPSPVRGRCAACRLFESRTERPSLRLVLCRVWQGTFMLEHLAEIAAINPTAAGRAPDEMPCVALGLIAHSSPEDGAAGNIWHSRTTTVGGVLSEY